jgi:S1-C subfamily serine protease/DNA-directed RNA polymerase subunit M/transcription elongation factor TFIIS
MIEFKCTGCGSILKVPDEKSGKKGKCPKCGSILSVPGAETDSGDFFTDLSKFAEMEKNAPVVPLAPALTENCPSCGRTILASARKCNYCGEFLDARQMGTGPKPVPKPSRMLASAKESRVSYYLSSFPKWAAVMLLITLVGVSYWIYAQWNVGLATLASHNAPTPEDQLNRVVPGAIENTSPKKFVVRSPNGSNENIGNQAGVVVNPTTPDSSPNAPMASTTPVSGPTAVPTSRPGIESPIFRPSPKPEYPSATPPIATTQPTEMTSKELYAKVSPSVVHILTDRGQGSGFLISPNLVATNYHVIDGATNITVILSDNTHLNVMRYAGQPQPDVAILEIPTAHFPALQITTKTPDPGEKVWAIGNPSYGEHIFNLSINEGMVSGIRWLNPSNGRWYDRGKDGKWYNDSGECIKLGGNDCFCYIQTSAQITHGSSGGPLLLATGEVVGITSAGAHNREESGDTTKFALSAAYIDDLLKGHAPKQTVRPNGSVSQEPSDGISNPGWTEMGFVNIQAEAGARNSDELANLDPGDFAVVSGEISNLAFVDCCLDVSITKCDVVCVESLPQATTSPASMPASAPVKKGKAFVLTEPDPKQMYDKLVSKYRTYDVNSANPIRKERDSEAWYAWLKKEMAGLRGKRVTWKIRVDSLTDRKPQVEIVRAYMKEYNDLLVLLKVPHTHTNHEQGHREGPFVYPDKDTVVVEPKTAEEEADIRWVSKELTKAGSYLASIRSFPYVLISGTRMAAPPPYKKPDSLPKPRESHR